MHFNFQAIQPYGGLQSLNRQYPVPKIMRGELVKQARAAGIIEVLQKPIPMKTLIKAIDNILAKQ